ncbi:nucleotidyltransferase domain-containing protein [Rhizobium sp. YIM 134829]|uniref:nucleotidyltransferase domain-containing protein n=1 Tax=Rhizobium sp. YIM 134829 TaxID=3390453 RepID=UPI00397E79C1
MNLTDEQLAAIHEWAAQNPLVVAVHLFGSRIRGNARPDSDLDVAVDLGFGEDVGVTWWIHKDAWDAELSAATHLTVSVELYHARMNREVYGYVADCGFEAYRRFSM